ncbi:hypothetical protein AYI98_01000 [Shewanella algae]|uniref:hypothetical protein n=1 Tax=Shewanella algae TaxID=38313 RepID=UPI001182B5A6|nr:hypothetical protein [Shewanella algae]TVL53753.1 hypothetical protein AYI98_01000 [Shewanella algae]
MSIKLNFIYTGIISIVTIVIQFLVVTVLGKQGPEMLASYNLIEIVFAFIPAFLLIGGDPYYQYKINNLECDNSRVIFHFKYVLYSFLLLFILASSLLSFYYFFSDKNLKDFYFLILVSLASYLIYISSFAERANLNILKSSIIERTFYLINGVVILSTVVVFGYTGEVDVVFNAALISSVAVVPYMLFRFVVFCHKNREVLSSSFDIGFSSVFDKGALYFWLTAITIFIYERVDQVFIAHYFEYAILGFYFACYKLSFILRLVTNVVYSVIYPYLAKFTKTDLSKALHMHKLSLYFTSVVAISLSLPLLFFPRQILEIVYDNRYVEYSFLLKIVALSMIFSCVNQVNFALINAKGKSKFIFYNSLVCVALQFIFIYMFYLKLGVLAVGVARLVAVSFGFIMSFYILGREFFKIHYLIIIFILLMVTFIGGTQ